MLLCRKLKSSAADVKLTQDLVSEPANPRSYLYYNYQNGYAVTKPIALIVTKGKAYHEQLREHQARHLLLDWFRALHEQV